MKTLFILPNRRVPYTAAQYNAENEARANRIACARIDFRAACFRLLCYSALAIGFSIAGGCLIQFSILLAK